MSTYFCLLFNNYNSVLNKIKDAKSITNKIFSNSDESRCFNYKVFHKLNNVLLSLLKHTTMMSVDYACISNIDYYNMFYNTNITKSNILLKEQSCLNTKNLGNYFSINYLLDSISSEIKCNTTSDQNKFLSLFKVLSNSTINKNEKASLEDQLILFKKLLNINCNNSINCYADKANTINFSNSNKIDNKTCNKFLSKTTTETYYSLNANNNHLLFKPSDKNLPINIDNNKLEKNNFNIVNKTNNNKENLIINSITVKNLPKLNIKSIQKVFDIKKIKPIDFVRSFKSRGTILNEIRKNEKNKCIILYNNNNNNTLSKPFLYKNKKIYNYRVDCVKKRIKTYFNKYVYKKLNHHYKSSNYNGIDKKFSCKYNSKLIVSNISNKYMRSFLNMTIKEIYNINNNDFNINCDKQLNNERSCNCKPNSICKFINKTYSQAFNDYKISSEKLRHLKKLGITEGFNYAKQLNDNIECFLDSYKQD